MWNKVLVPGPRPAQGQPGCSHRPQTHISKSGGRCQVSHLLHTPDVGTLWQVLHPLHVLAQGALWPVCSHFSPSPAASGFCSMLWQHQLVERWAPSVPGASQVASGREDRGGSAGESLGGWEDRGGSDFAGVYAHDGHPLSSGGHAT